MARTRRKFKKRTFARRKRKFTTRGRTKVTASRSVIKYSVGRQMPLPPRYVTKFTISDRGYQPPVATDWIYAYIKLNGLASPFNTSHPVTNGDRNVTLALPAGLQSLLNANAYRGYRVFASSIMYKLTPQNPADQLGVLIIPNQVGVPIEGLAPGPLTYSQLLAQPMARNMNFNSSQNKQWCKNRISVSKFYGVRSSAIKDDLSGQFIGTADPTTGNLTDPSNQVLWSIWIKDLQGNTITQNVGYELKITYYVELFNLAIGNYEDLA